MSILALSALVSSAVAEECCCGDVKPEAKAEVMEAVCPCPEACMKAQDENCCKEDCKSEMMKSQKIQGSKVQLKFNYNGRETAGEAYVPNNMDVKVTVDDVAFVSMTISALDNDRVAVKACTLAMDKDTGEMVPQEEATTQEAALGEQVHFAWKDLTMNITVLEVCDLNVASEQATEQEAVQPEVAPEQAPQAEFVSQVEEAPQAEQAIESEAVTEQAPEVEQVSQAVEQVA